ncbi:MAG TPA: hypothetical protein VII43_00735 [Opitutaceae bacterium]
MNENSFGFWMTVAGTGCWAVCFVWMYRISSSQNHLLEKQNNLLEKLSDQGKRIEKLSKMEHDLIKEVHPQVSDIKEGMEEMIAAVKENTESNNNPPAEAKPAKA